MATSTHRAATWIDPEWREPQTRIAAVRAEVAEYPQVVRRIFNPPSEEEGCAVPFRLIYKGFLPAEGSGDSRRKLKHSIRKQFHPQLKELWERNPSLRRRKGLYGLKGRTALDELADNYARCGFRFVPLISKRNGLGCSLDIVFLRRDEPGDIMRGGDLDNRLKTLNDGFKVPTECSQLEGFTPEPDENPFFCLMEDDSLITEVKITTDRLLIPVEQHENEVLLIIQATAVLLDPNNAWPGLHV